jgi:hypothetical protein
VLHRGEMEDGVRTLHRRAQRRSVPNIATVGRYPARFKPGRVFRRKDERPNRIAAFLECSDQVAP